MTNSFCACGSGRPLPACCGPYLEGQAHPPSAEALMRARYSAYAGGDADFIVRTEVDADPEAVRNWMSQVRFTALRVLETRAGGPEDQTGEVVFEADFVSSEGPSTHRERSQFSRDSEGNWIFVRGQQTPMRAEPKVGRNDPCPCGSGKKYKKCCA